MDSIKVEGMFHGMFQQCQRYQEILNLVYH